MPKTFLTKSNLRIDEFGVGLDIRRHDNECIYLEMYYNDFNDNEKGMDFFFKTKEEVDEFITDLNKLRNEVWPDDGKLIIK